MEVLLNMTFLNKLYKSLLLTLKLTIIIFITRMRKCTMKSNDIQQMKI